MLLTPRNKAILRQNLFPLPQATIDMDFARGRYFGKTLSDLTFTRALAAYAEDAGGVYTQFGSGAPRITNKGFLIEEARTNSIRNNSAQGATIGVVGSGGALPTNWNTQNVAGLT